MLQAELINAFLKNNLRANFFFPILGCITHTQGAVMKKLLPLGISDYKKLRESNAYYVDKTLLIKDIQERGKAILISRPYSFGKTVNLSMLYYFYANEASNNAPLFVDTEIWKLKEYHELQGAFPVIYLSFKEIAETHFAGQMAEFQYAIAQEFRKHAYLLEGPILDADEKGRFERISREKASALDLRVSLEFLVRMLARYHNKRVIVLIDDYDTPIQTAYLHGFYDETIAFVQRLFIGALKDQPDLEKGVIMGNFPVAGLIDFSIFKVVDAIMADKFGFTQTEVNELLQYYQLEAKKDDIEQWYGNYTFGKTAGIFNPLSLLKCIHRGGRCEVDIKDTFLLKKMITRGPADFTGDLIYLFQSQSVPGVIEHSIFFPTLLNNLNQIWSLLLFSGYLTYTQSRIKDGGSEWDLIIPNQEIEKMFKAIVRDIFEQMLSGSPQRPIER
jgi:Predicted AAA-ATPase